MKPAAEKSPFDAIADEYDSQQATNSVFRWMREQVWEITEKYVLPGQRVLELGCGTGIDAIHFAEKGIQWLAIDSSPAMLHLLERKAERLNSRNSIRARLMDLNDLKSAAVEDHDGSFDLVFSNFGALNCSIDLKEISVYMDRVLKRGGFVIGNIMSRWCCWEMIYYLMRLRPRTAFRRFTKSGLLVRVGCRFVLTRYFGPREVIHSFEPKFQVEEIIGLGIFVPPPYLAHRADRHPGFFSRARELDRMLRTLPFFRAIGDHMIVVMRKPG